MKMTIYLGLLSITVLSCCLTTQSFYLPVKSTNQGRLMSGLSASLDNQIYAPSWDDLKTASAKQAVGNALNKEVEKRQTGKGSAHVQSKLRLFSSEDKPKITLYRDHAGCKYSFTESCQYYFLSAMLTINV